MALDTSYLFGNTAPTSIGATTTDTSNTLPAWLQDYTRGLMGRATQTAGEAYQPYTGARIADQTPEQLQAQQKVQAQQGSWQPGMAFAGSTAPQNVSAYMNPYISNVTDRIAQLGQRNLTENLLPQVNSTFIGAGQFGSDRSADFTNRAVRDTNESILGQQGQALQTGYQNAVTNFQNDATRAGNVANMGTQLGYQDVGMLDTIGQQKQALGQKALDLGYTDFQNQVNYPKTQLQFLNEMVRGLPNTSSAYQTQTTAAPNPVMSPLQQAASAFAGTRATLAGPAPVYNYGQPQQKVGS